MFSIQRCVAPDFGSTNIRLFDTELATMSDALSGVGIRWCGSLPVGTVATTWRDASSIRLSVASPEFRTMMLLAQAIVETTAAPAARAILAAARTGRDREMLRMKA